MNGKIGWIVAVVVAVVAVGYYFYPQFLKAPTVSEQSNTQDLGTYNYECDEHVGFSMTPSADVSSIKIAATGGGAYPPAVTLTKQSSTSGVLYTGGGVTFAGKGETVTLGTGDSAINCSPVADANNAPFNWGN